MSRCVRRRPEHKPTDLIHFRYNRKTFRRASPWDEASTATRAGTTGAILELASERALLARTKSRTRAKETIRELNPTTSDGNSPNM